MRFTSSACSVCERKTVCVKDMPGADTPCRLSVAVTRDTVGLAEGAGVGFFAVGRAVKIL